MFESGIKCVEGLKSCKLMGLLSSLDFLLWLQLLLFFFLLRLGSLLFQCQFVFYCCEKTSWLKASWGGENLFGLTLSHHNPSLKEAKAEAQAGTEPGTMEEHDLLVAPWPAQLLSDIPGSESGLDLPTPVIHQTCPNTLANLTEAVAQVRFLPPRSLQCVSSWWNANQHLKS